MPLPNLAQDIPLDYAGILGGATPPAGPPLSFFQKVRLGYKADQARPSWGFNETNWKNSAIAEVNDALRKKGIDPAVDLMDNGSIERGIRRGDTAATYIDRAYRTVFAQVAKVRETDPNFLGDYAPVIDKASFDELVRGRQKAQGEEVAREAPEGLGFGGFLGGLAHGSLDPINYLPVGGEVAQGASIGRRVLLNGLKWGAVNTGITAITEPLVRQHARELGVDRTNEDFAVDLAGAGVGGFILGGPIAEGLRVAGGKVADVLKKRRDPTGTAFDSFDAKVAQTFSELVPEDQRTPDEQAAIHAIQREAEIKATSPFVAGPAGDDANAAHLDRGMAALNGAPQAPRTVKPIQREQVAGPGDVEGARLPARELLKAKIHSAEGDGPNRLGGSALGPYQFVPRTWVNLFKRRYPGDKRGFDEIAALRTDPHLNDVLINDLISENSAALQHAGFEANAGNLYLAHVLGHDRAVTVLRAAADEKLGALLPHDYFAKNPFKATDSSASLIRWAYGKMGDKGFPEHAASPEVAAGAEAIGVGEADPLVETVTGEHVVEAMFGDPAMTDRPILKPELFGSAEEHAAAQVRFERESDMAEGFAPVMSRAEAFSPYEHFDALRRYRGTVTPDAIGEALGLNPDEVVKAVRTMQSLDRNSPFVLARERGAAKDAEPTRVMRRPRQAKSLIQFLADRGGLNDIGGEVAAMDADVGRRFRKPLVNKDGGMALDEALSLAMEHEYFPELGFDAHDSKPDVQHLLDAIDAELRGEKRLPVDQLLDAAEARRQAVAGQERVAPEAPPRMTPEEIAAEIDPEHLDAWHDLARERGFELSDAEAIEAYYRFYDGPAKSVDDAIADTIMAAAARDAEEFAALSGDLGYDDVRHEWETYAGEQAEVRGDGEPGLGDDPGERRSPAPTGSSSPGRAALEAAAHDPEKREFGDPAGVAAEAQADSLIHDAAMAADDGATYRLDEEGGEADLQSILDEIEQAQKAATEMRNCLKPKGGDE